MSEQGGAGGFEALQQLQLVVPHGALGREQRATLRFVELQIRQQLALHVKHFPRHHELRAEVATGLHLACALDAVGVQAHVLEQYRHVLSGEDGDVAATQLLHRRGPDPVGQGDQRIAVQGPTQLQDGHPAGRGRTRKKRDEQDDCELDPAAQEHLPGDESS